MTIIILDGRQLTERRYPIELFVNCFRFHNWGLASDNCDMLQLKALICAYKT